MAGAVKPREVVYYQNDRGYIPFFHWLEGLKDIKTRQRILARMRRLQGGQFGDCKSVGDGVFELRLFFGAGYRVYFGEEADRLVIILCGGDKSSQNKDIKIAKAYWQEYREND